MNENEIGQIIVDIAVKLHADLGPGLLESVYEGILANKLENRGLLIYRQTPIPMEYEGIKFEESFRADLIINNKVIVEIKSVEHFNNAHKKQVLTYLKLTGFKLGFLLNFGESLMKHGICRVINGKII